MADKEPRPSSASTIRLAVVNWQYPDESVVSGCPIDYDAALAVAQAYQARYPGRRSWISIPPLLDR
jgi:hypothetical protein